MDRLTDTNPADNTFAASDAAVQRPQQPPQAAFEQHLGEARQLGPTYPHSDLYKIAAEDDRLIQAASGAALRRGPTPNATTVEIYDRRLRKLAEELEKSGQSIAGLDGDTLLDCAKKLLPNDKVIVPALSLVSQYRETDPTARPITSHYRPSKEDDRLIREAAKVRFGRPIKQTLADNYASCLRKLAAALRPLSMAKLSHEALLGYAKSKFPNDKKLIYALNGLRDYRALVRQSNSGPEASTLRLPAQPAAESAAQHPDQERSLQSAVHRGSQFSDHGFNAPQRWQEMSLAAHFPEQSVAEDVLFGAGERSGELPVPSLLSPASGQSMRSPSHEQWFGAQVLDAPDREDLPPEISFTAPVLWPGMNSSAHWPVQSVAPEELSEAADRELLPPAMTFHASVRWQPMSSATGSAVQSAVQEASFNAVDLEGYLLADGLDAPEFWSEMWSAAHPSTPSIGQKDLFGAEAWQPGAWSQNPASARDPAPMTRRDDAAPAMLEQTPPAATDSFDASLVVPETFSHGTQPAPDMMRSKLGRWGLLPDATQRVRSFDIRGENYAAVLGPQGYHDVQLIHLRRPAVGDTFDVSFAVPKDFSHGTQHAPELMLSTLGKWDFLPDAKYPFMNYKISGERYTAVLGPEGRNDVQLIHHPRLVLPDEAAPAAPEAASDVDGLATGFGLPASFELQKSAPSALAPHLLPPSAEPAPRHQPAPQLLELGELFGNDWRHGPREASPVMVDMLQNLGLLPNQDVPMTRFLIHGEPYTAESLPGGGVLLFHRPQFG
ncbi:hypothetical protein AOQ72_20915 [Bradyrhizobium yuanmingense]|uniref:Uncharacterized protein n=2 Tax=Bradyrhizobium yuanmingense TaxID=108015 RepID=A0A0R3CHB8_9BRAD|nr:hypothetical protein AOQ72_20915 [Bradyrhizobium yuanmingense]